MNGARRLTEQDAVHDELDRQLEEDPGLKELYEDIAANLHAVNMEPTGREEWMDFERRYLFSGRRRRNLIFRYAAVACVLVALTVGLSLYFRSGGAARGDFFRGKLADAFGERSGVRSGFRWDQTVCTTTRYHATDGEGIDLPGRHGCSRYPGVAHDPGSPAGGVHAGTCGWQPGASEHEHHSPLSRSFHGIDAGCMGRGGGVFRGIPGSGETFCCSFRG